MSHRRIDYYFATVSPWTLPRATTAFVALAQQHGATIAREADEPRRGVPGVGRPAAVEARAAAAGVSAGGAQALVAVTSACRCNIQPKFFPANGDLAARWILAAAELGTEQALALTGAVGRALWAQERDIADAATLAAIARRMRARRRDARRARASPDIAARYAALTQEAIARGVFGAPTYVVDGRTVLGTGPTRLPGPQTGKIACFRRPGTSAGRQAQGG